MAIVYVQRKTPTSIAHDLFKDLLKFRIPVLHLTKDLLSKRKPNNPDKTKPYPKLHVRSFLEVKLLTTLRSYNYDIMKIVTKNERLSQSKRKKAAADVTTKHWVLFLSNFCFLRRSLISGPRPAEISMEPIGLSDKLSDKSIFLCLFCSPKVPFNYWAKGD